MWINDLVMTLKHKGCCFQLIYNRCFGTFLCIYICELSDFCASCCVCVRGTSSSNTYDFNHFAADCCNPFSFPHCCMLVCIPAPSACAAVPLQSFSIMCASSPAVIAYCEVYVFIWAAACPVSVSVMSSKFPELETQHLNSLSYSVEVDVR